ncbi:hypothetical protein J7E62_04390 [Variovorax paradoxus]|nr:hypothetical protein [Variovorax paradoxus]
MINPGKTTRTTSPNRELPAPREDNLPRERIGINFKNLPIDRALLTQLESLHERVGHAAKERIDIAPALRTVPEDISAVREKMLGILKKERKIEHRSALTRQLHKTYKNLTQSKKQKRDEIMNAIYAREEARALIEKTNNTLELHESSKITIKNNQPQLARIIHGAQNTEPHIVTKFILNTGKQKLEINPSTREHTWVVDKTSQIKSKKLKTQKSINISQKLPQNEIDRSIPEKKQQNCRSSYLRFFGKWTE